MKERLTGAIILVALIVLLVPELLTGPIRTKSAPAASATRAEAPLRSYTLTLGGSHPADAAPATAAAQTPAQPAPDAHQSPPESSAQSPPEAHSEGSGPQQAPPEAATPPSGPPSVSRQSAGPDPALQVASTPAHQAVREARVAASAGGWVVQLGSFASRKNANRLAHSLAARGFHMSVSSARSGSRVLWRVRAGPAHDRAGAQRLAVRLRALGHRGELLPVK